METSSWEATKAIASTGTSCFWRGKRPSIWKYLSRSAKPRRLVPSLYSTSASSLGWRVHCASRSSLVHSRFISDTPSSARESSRRDCFVDNRLAGEYRGKAAGANRFVRVMPIVKRLIEHTGTKCCFELGFEP